ncbi:MAG: DUF853 family protein [Eggerthellaceae bacterium]|nr:DUF853 family protein [Eggerthellaceae bacterium]
MASANGYQDKCHLLLNQANRHGLITGASGTGKTVTIKVMIEAFSQAGVPVFMADVKGDVGGMAQAGENSENIQKRLGKFGIVEGYEGKDYDTMPAEEWAPLKEYAQTWLQGCPCRFWNMAGAPGKGIPVRVKVSDMGPVMLARLLDLTDTQEGVLNIVFRIADDRQLELIDLKDLRSMLTYVADHADEFKMDYGNVAKQSVASILRSLIAVEDQGGTEFFGEPELDLNDWFACDSSGQGYVNILNATRLINQPQLYAMFLLWMLSELFETLPEVGDLEKPKFVFVFDEAHLLFNNMPSELLDKIVQVVKLVRSKGVGVYFCSQSPSDIPNEVLAQLSNKVQHALRAYTPAEQKAVKAAAASVRENPAFKTEDVITELGTGEALVSFLDDEGVPTMVQQAKILPPQCLMAAPDEALIDASIANSTSLVAKYGEAVDSISAYEKLIEEAQEAAKQEEENARIKELEAQIAEMEKQKAKEEEKLAREAEKAAERAARAAEKEAERQRVAEERARQKQHDETVKTINQVGRTILNQIARNILGGRKR